jgi:ABC-type lipoprotein export system ATPase subunit
MTGLAVKCDNVGRIYDLDGEEVVALEGVTLDLPAGSATAITGPSGSGKSTLMTILAGLQRPTSGRVFIGVTEITALTERGLLDLRAASLAVMVQNPQRNLIPYGTSEDNIRFARRGAAKSRTLESPDNILGQLGLGALANVRVDRLSGGERQRVALATGLATDPDVLLADEPTSQLDESNRDSIVELLRRISADRGVTVVAVTHDPYVAEQLGYGVAIADGRVGERKAAR